MCGIAGIAGQIEPDRDQRRVERMINTMRHRGPSAKGFWRAIDRTAIFGHARLSIIDLTPASNQPMATADGQVSLVFNGEIYNYNSLRDQLKEHGHVFVTSGDTEVLLKAYMEWGIECLAMLDGMFALAIYDKNAGKLWLARDRIGEKPLYYYLPQGKNQIWFSSESHSLVAAGAPAQLDPISVSHYLAYGYVGREGSMLKDIHKVSPGQMVQVSIKNMSIDKRHYWQPDFDASAMSTSSLDDNVTRLDQILESAVRSRLVADVSVGVLLSGGLDSGLITAYAARAKSHIKTFTVAVPGSMDESHDARVVARHFSTDHMEIRIDANILEMMPKIACFYDDPIADHSAIPTYLICKEIAQHVTVALGGDGGDELFGGYPYYKNVQRKVHFPGDAIIGKFLPIGFPGKNRLSHFGKWGQGIGANMLFDAFDRKLVCPMLNQLSAEQLLDPEIRRHGIIRGQSSLLSGVRMMDILNYLPEDILTKCDRASMRNSIELRAPFLANNVVDFALSLPSEQLCNTSQTKILLRKLAGRHLPPNPQHAIKRGFGLPINSWMKTSTAIDFVKSVLITHESIFHSSFIERLLIYQKLGLKIGTRLFALVMFELWRNNLQKLASDPV